MTKWYRYINLQKERELEMLNKNKKESLVLGKMLKKIAPRIGAKIILEPDWNIVGQINFRSGKRSYFRYNTVDLNPMGSSEIAKDKDYANFFMKKMGYPIVPGSKTFFSDKWGKAIGASNRNIDAAYRYAKGLGLPVIVKPNSGSQGKNVALVSDKKDFYQAMRAIFEIDRVALVQRAVFGKDYRIVVLEKKVISAYERVPLNVVGDGKSTIARLLEKKQKEFVASSRDTRINLKDSRIKMKLSRSGFTFRSVPDKGERVFLLDNANLSSGGDSIDVTQDIHPKFEKLAINLTKDMGLRLCGVDLMIDGDISKKMSPFWVLEINSAPGLDHYARSGKKQEKIVEKLYLEVLKSLDK